MTRPPLLSFIRRSARLGALGGLGLGVAYLVTVNFLASLTLIFLAFAAIFGIVAGSITGGLFGVLLAFFSARYFKNGTHVTQLRRYRVTVLVMSFVFWWIFSTLILSLELAALFVNSTRALGLSLVTTMWLPGLVAAFYSLYVSRHLIQWDLSSRGLVKTILPSQSAIKYTF